MGNILWGILGISQRIGNKNSDSSVKEAPGNGKDFGHGKAIVLFVVDQSRENIPGFPNVPIFPLIRPIPPVFFKRIHFFQIHSSSHHEMVVL